MSLKCGVNKFESLYGNVMSYYTEYIKKKNTINRMWAQLYTGREEEANRWATATNEYFYLANLVYAILVNRMLYGGNWGDFISVDELKCIIHNFQCRGIDVKPFLRNFGIDPYDPNGGNMGEFLPCSDEGIGDLIIEDPICPWTIR